MRTKKTISSFATLILVIMLNGCSTNKSLPTGEVNYISGNDGTISMRAIGMGNNEGEATTDAIYNAFDVLLFRGLPESEQKNALVGTNENEERGKHKDYFDGFYKGRYKTFVMSTIPTGNLIKYKGGKKSMAVDVKINALALRKDLEQNGIIRKFGF